MTSKLVLDNIAGRTTAGSITIVGEGNSTTTNLQHGLAKAWGSFEDDATIAATNTSFNIASINDDATGSYTYTFTNNMAYESDDTPWGGNCGGSARFLRSNNTNSTTSAVSVKVHNSSGTAVDNTNRWALHGDLA